MDGRLAKIECARRVVMANGMKSEMKISEPYNGCDAPDLLGFSLSADVADYSGPQKLDSAEALNLGWAAGGNQYGDQEESYERI